MEDQDHIEPVESLDVATAPLTADVIARHPEHTGRSEVVASGPQSQMMAVIERVATAPDLPIDRLEKMLDMQERIMRQNAKAEHASAVADAMAELPSIPMNGRGHNKMPYATLKDITSVTRPVLARHGLSLGFDTTVGEKAITITAKLAHRNGHEETTSISLPFDNSGSKNAVQAIGSSQTYGQRYTAQAILGLSLGDDVEDDGRAGGAGETVSHAQLDQLRLTLEETGGDEARFCKYWRVQNLADILSADVGKAISAMREAQKRREAADA